MDPRSRRKQSRTLGAHAVGRKKQNDGGFNYSVRSRASSARSRALPPSQGSSPVQPRVKRGARSASTHEGDVRRSRDTPPFHVGEEQRDTRVGCTDRLPEGGSSSCTAVTAVMNSWPSKCPAVAVKRLRRCHAGVQICCRRTRRVHS